METRSNRRTLQKVIAVLFCGIIFAVGGCESTTIPQTRTYLDARVHAVQLKYKQMLLQFAQTSQDGLERAMKADARVEDAGAVFDYQLPKESSPDAQGRLVFSGYIKWKDDDHTREEAAALMRQAFKGAGMQPPIIVATLPHEREVYIEGYLRVRSVPDMSAPAAALK